MNWFIRILGLIGTAALGYASVFIVYAIGLTLMVTLPADQYLHAFKVLFFGGGLICVLVGAGLGVMRFFTGGLWRTVFTWLPVLLPAVYCCVVMTYFALLG